MILVANKVDLVHLRQVTTEQGKELANILKVISLSLSSLSINVIFIKIPYIETSAKNPPINVDNAFHEVVRIIRNQPQHNEKPTKKSKSKSKNKKCDLM
jgi:Ras-related protein M-Ras